MISKNLEEMINKQINMELFSAYLYLSMSNKLNEDGLKGFSSWYMTQYKEEMDHAMYLYHYLQVVGGSVKLDAIATPDDDFKGTMDILERALAHEQLVTASLNKIYAAAHTEGDFKTSQFLLWFVNEQVEEEENAEDNIQRLRLAGEHNLFLVDQEMGTRVYTASTNPPIAIL